MERREIDEQRSTNVCISMAYLYPGILVRREGRKHAVHQKYCGPVRQVSKSNSLSIFKYSTDLQNNDPQRSVALIAKIYSQRVDPLKPKITGHGQYPSVVEEVRI